MSTSLKRSLFAAAPVRGVSIMLALATGALLAGCIVAAPAPRVYAPPPPPPPPPAYETPGDEAQAAEAPPPLPEYPQPPCPVEGYLWTPGYWAYAPAGYYWVPGTWVQPPRVGVLWTPGYWGFVGGVYAFHAGYWGPHIGFYGGVNYGFGYTGVGFAGGRWVGGAFAYNQAVANINVTVVHNTYNETVVNNVTVVNRVSFNGGAGGIVAAPTAQERMAAQEPHTPPTPMQRQHVQTAAQNPALFAKANGGRPAIAATPRPGAFNAPGIVGARGAEPPPARPGAPPAHGNKANTPLVAGQPNGTHTPQGPHGQSANGKPPPKAKPPKPHGDAPAEKHEPESAAK
jgi:YXWGXW repeat-containing protein